MDQLTRRRVAVAASVALLFALAVALVLALGSASSQPQAQPGTEASIVSATQTPFERWAAVQQTIEAERAKPRFAGMLNGFRFYDPAAGDLPTRNNVCTPQNFREIQGADAIALAQSSSLNFEPTYLPARYEQTSITVSTCDGAVRHIGRAYAIVENGVPGPSFSIAHSLGPAESPAFYPADRLEATTIAGRTAIIVHPYLAQENGRIMMREGDEMWSVNGDHTVGELRRVAEGIATR